MKKMLSLLLATVAVFTLVACNNASTDTSSSSASIPTPATSDSAPSTPEPEPVVLEQAYLTGEEKTYDYPEGKRITAIMVNNIASARPANGLSDAKIVVEIVAEGGITRFMALYEDYETIPKVGSLRSARDQFLQLIIPSQAFYVHVGPDQNQPTNWMIRDYDYEEFDIQPKHYSGLYTREPSRDTNSYNWFDVSGEGIKAAIEKKGSDDFRSYGSPMFAFVPYTDPPRVPELGTASEVAVVHSASYRSLFQYNEGLGQYEMSQWNSNRGRVEETVDNNNGQRLGFDNVLVLFAPMSLYDNSILVKADYGVGGAGYLFTRGGYELIYWRKGAPDSPLRLTSSDGNESTIQLNVGTTYLAMVDDDRLPEFHDTLMAGNAGEVVGDGDVNPNEKESDD